MCRAESAFSCAKHIKGRCSSFGAVPMGRSWPAAAMMGPSGSGTCTVASISTHCGVTDPTSGSLSQESRAFPKHKRRRYTHWGRSGKRTLEAKCVLFPMKLDHDGHHVPGMAHGP